MHCFQDFAIPLGTYQGPVIFLDEACYNHKAKNQTQFKRINLHNHENHFRANSTQDHNIGF